MILPTAERAGPHVPPVLRDERFAQLWRAYHPSVLAYARRRASAEDAAEVADSAFAVLWGRIDDPPSDPLPWLYAVARRQLANQRRAHERRSALGLRLRNATVASRTVPDPAEGATDALGALAVLSQLRADDREILMLIAWEGLDPDQAATALGVRPSTFAVRLHRARRRLESQMTDPKEPR